MARGGKRDGAGRKPTGNPIKSIVRRLTIKEVEILDSHQRSSKLEETVDHIYKVEDFKVYKLKGELVIKVKDLVEAKVLQ